MKFCIGLLLATLQVIVIISGETVQLESSQGILIPAPLAHSVRVARGSYGGPAPSAAVPSSYSAPGPAPSSSYSAPAPAISSYAAPASSSYSSPAAPSQQISSIPAPPCPRNYLFSCQPSLSPVPCAAATQAPAPSGGSYSSPQGAYSQFIPQYAVPVVRELF